MIETWYFVAHMLAGSNALGPLTEQDCRRVEMTIPAYGRCVQALYLTACPVPGRPYMSTACPIFRDAPPSATVKPKVVP